MKTDSFSINYQLVPHGTEKTDLIFYNNINEIFENLLNECSQNVICTDSNVANISFVKNFLEKAENSQSQIIIIPAGEENKTIESVLSIVKGALEKSFSRSCRFIAIGGGVISDMTAFASSLFKRGAKLEIVPTTLLSMADACIGGKTGCDTKSHPSTVWLKRPNLLFH